MSQYDAEYTELIESVKREAAKDEHDSAELRRLADEFRKLGNEYKDAIAIAEECERVARNQELKDKYKTLTGLKRAAVSAEDFQALSEAFRAMGAFPNASAEAAECEKRYQELTNEHFSAEMSEENDSVFSERKLEEQRYYSEYNNATAEMQRLSRQKTFKPKELQKLANQWKQLSTQFANIADYRDARTLSSECGRESAELSGRAELFGKIWKILKFAVIAVFAAAVLTAAIYLILLLFGVIERETDPEPEEPPIEEEMPEPEPVIQMWNDAYREFLLSQEHSFVADGSDDATIWGTDNIRFAELADFNNDGTPELVLIIDIPDSAPESPEHSQYWLLILGFTDTIIPIFNEYIYAQGLEVDDYAIATNADGRHYFVHRFVSYNWNSYNYMILNNGQWESSLAIEFIPGFTSIDEVVEDEFMVNGEIATEAEYNNAESSILNIVKTRVLGPDTVNDVRALIAKLGDTYMYGNIPNNSSLREPLNVQFYNIVTNTTDAVRLPVRWSNGEFTTFFRETGSTDWSMTTRAGATGDALPTFAMNGDIISIAFPTTDKLYYLLSNFTGRFSNPDGTGSESMTWTFILG
jgi:hypothetical protein